MSSTETIFTTVTNTGYLLYTLNMLKSIAPFGLDKRVHITCLDKKSAAILQSKGYQAVYEESYNVSSRFCPWNTPGYDEICYVKLKMIHSFLQAQKNVVLLDGDIVFLKDPMRDVLHWLLSDDDVWFQNDSVSDKDHRNMCTRYMMIRANDKMRTLYDCVSEEGLKKYEACAFKNNDQTYFNQFVKPYCRMRALPLLLYPNGQRFYQTPDQSSPILVHFNWVIGHLKMAKMKEHHLWLLTEEEEY